MISEERREAYWFARLKWAREREDEIVSKFASIGAKFGVEMSPEVLESARKRCIEELKFSYPAEYKFSSIVDDLSDKKVYDEALSFAIEMFRELRIEFGKYRRDFIQ